MTAQNRRRYPRYPVNTEVILRDSGGRSMLGTVRDICKRGVYVEDIDPLNRLEMVIGSRFMLFFRLPLKEASQELEIPSTVARLIDEGIGFSFEAISPAIARIIDGQLDQYIASRPPTQALSHPTDTDQAMAILRRTTSQHLDPLLGKLFETIENALWDAVDHAGSDSERFRLTGEATLFSNASLEDKVTLYKKLLAESAHPTPSMQQADDATNEVDQHLALVDEGHFEQWLERSAIANRLEDDLQEPLQTLRSQARQFLAKDSQPLLQPERFADAVIATLTKLGISGESIHTSLLAGKQVLIPLLDHYYRSLSQGLRGAGIEPRIERKWAVKIKPAPVRQPRAEDGPGEQAQIGEGSPPMPVRQVAHPAPVGAHRVSDLLRTLPRDALHAIGEKSALPLKEQVTALMAEASPGMNLDSRLKERIDATEKVIARIAEGGEQPSQVREWVNQLTLSLLAGAVEDPAFFRGEGHPLLAIVGQLEHLGKFLPSKGGLIESEIEALLTAIIATDSQDQAGYDAINRRLDDIEGSYEERCQGHVVRAIRALKGRERIRNAHHQIEQRLEQALKGKRVHQSVIELLEVAWKQLLELLYLKENGFGKHWLRAWHILMQLHPLCGGECDDNVTTPPDWQRLVEKVRAGLAYQGINPFLSKKLERRLERAVTRTRNKLLDDSEFLLYLPPGPPDAKQTKMDERPAHIGLGDWQHALSQIEALTINAELHIQTHSAEKRLRLVWISTDGCEFAFLDTQGPRILSMSRVEVASSLHKGHMTIGAPENHGIVERAMDGTLKEMQERLDYSQSHDMLTGLKNRPQFTGHLTRLLLGPESAHSQHVLGILEIDQFEAIISACGYSAGDNLLQAVARLLENRFEDNAYLAFLGTRRFGFLVDAPRDAVDIGIGQQLNADLSALPLYWQGKSYPISVSIGLVHFSPEARDPEALLSAADLACTSAQEAGSAQVVLFRKDDDLIVRKQERMQWLIKTEEALKAERIRLRGQLIKPIDPEAGFSPHYEVLLSVFDEQGAPLNLGEFIATAEAFNRMSEVDRLVIRKALQWVRDNTRQARAMGGIAINLSGQSMADAGLVAFIRQQMSDFKIPSELVSFEVTETSAIASLDQAVTIIEEFKAMGCHMAIDDFGTGMSSYTYLKQLPVDYLKIDGSFIKDMLNNPRDQAIVKSVNEIAHFMGMRTIAEYVENLEILDRLGEIGVDYAQGYALEKPRFLDEIP